MRKTTLHYLHLPPDTDLPALTLPAPFLAIVLVEDEVTETWMWETARWLVASGCHYVLAWGRACDTWREAVDDAAEEAADYEDVPDERRVLSTAHEDDDMDEVFWFARHRAVHPALPLETTLIVHIADAPRREDIERAYAQA
jgi:hypothetical protein